MSHYRARFCYTFLLGRVMRKEYNIFHEVRAVNGVFYLWKCWGVSSLLALRAETYSFVRF